MSKLKNYKVTFWRGNPQLQNGGYHTVRVMRGIDEDHIWDRAYKRDCLYGSMSPVSVEEIKDGETVKEGRLEERKF